MAGPRGRARVPRAGAAKRPIRIFLLGAYRSFEPHDRDLRLLRGLRDELRTVGWDAFLAIDDRAVELLGAEDPPPLSKTRRLAARSDACFFVLTGTGRLAGVVAELTSLQIERPERAGRRVVFVEEGYPLSSILDADQEGILAAPRVVTVPFEGVKELHRSAVNYAALIARYGDLLR